jgi:hypothetical protein
MVFLPGTAAGIILPRLNHRANIWAMKKLGVQWIVSVSAVRSLQAKCTLRHRHGDQFFDRRSARSGILRARHRGAWPLRSVYGGCAATWQAGRDLGAKVMTAAT